MNLSVRYRVLESQNRVLRMTDDERVRWSLAETWEVVRRRSEIEHVPEADLEKEWHWRR